LRGARGDEPDAEVAQDAAKVGRLLRAMQLFGDGPMPAQDTVRFFALRLNEAGMIKSGPKKIIAQGTDWSFLNELKREPEPGPSFLGERLLSRFPLRVIRESTAA